eukprot:Nk52_evm53s78 gene=Nk52_evmTU53s78
MIQEAISSKMGEGSKQRVGPPAIANRTCRWKFLIELLRRKGFNVKESHNTPVNAIIFPACSIVFQVIDLSSPVGDGKSLIAETEKVLGQFKTVIVTPLLKLNSMVESQIMFINTLQKSFLKFPTSMLITIDSFESCVRIITSLTECYKRERLSRIIRLTEQTVNIDIEQSYPLTLLKSIGLDEHEHVYVKGLQKNTLTVVWEKLKPML